MVQQKKRQTHKGIIIFVLLVLFSGALLSMTGNMQNPFDALSNVVTFF